MEKVAIITGAAQGIGFAFAQGLAREGYAIVVGDMKGADEAAAKLSADGARAIGVKVDVANAVEVDGLAAAAVERFGGIDVLVNNAALFAALGHKRFDEILESDWMRVMQVNTLGPFLCAKAVVPHMRARGGGRIINVASTSVNRGTPMMLHYVSSKGAVVGFTRSLARELGNENITVNAISPGFTLSTGMLESSRDQTNVGVATRAARSIQRDQVPEDLVGTVVFLASDGASYVTGQTIAVDGGTVFL